MVLLTDLATRLEAAVTAITAAVPKVQTLATEHAAFVAGTAIPPAIQAQIDALDAPMTALTAAAGQLTAALPTG